MHPSDAAAALERAKALGLGLSAYIRLLIGLDLGIIKEPPKGGKLK